MIGGCPFLYQTSNGDVYSVNKNGLYAIQFWSSDKDIVAFVDVGRNNYDPNDMLHHPTVQIILATSLRGANWHWIKRAGGITKLITELWSPHELFVAGFVLGSLLSMLY